MTISVVIYYLYSNVIRFKFNKLEDMELITYLLITYYINTKNTNINELKIFILYTYEITRTDD